MKSKTILFHRSLVVVSPPVVDPPMTPTSFALDLSIHRSSTVYLSSFTLPNSSLRCYSLCSPQINEPFSLPPRDQPRQVLILIRLILFHPLLLASPSSRHDLMELIYRTPYRSPKGYLPSDRQLCVPQLPYGQKVLGFSHICKIKGRRFPNFTNSERFLIVRFIRMCTEAA